MKDPAATLREKMESTIPRNEVYLTRRETAELLGVKPSTLEAKASTSYDQLPFSKVGIRAMYRLDHVLGFIASRRKGGV